MIFNCQVLYVENKFTRKNRKELAQLGSSKYHFSKTCKCRFQISLGPKGHFCIALYKGFFLKPTMLICIPLNQNLNTLEYFPKLDIVNDIWSKICRVFLQTKLSMISSRTHLSTVSN